MFMEDLQQYLGHIIRVNRFEADDYVGPLTSVDIHDDASLPGADRLHFYQDNTGRTVTIYRAEIKDITDICKA